MTDTSFLQTGHIARQAFRYAMFLLLPRAMTQNSLGFCYWTYRRSFVADGLPCTVAVRCGLTQFESTLSVCDVEHDRCYRPASGPEAIINHALSATLPSGKRLDVEAGFNSWINVGIAAKLDGALVHESHPGKAIQMPAAAAKMTAQTTADGKPAMDMGKLKANKVPIIVDIATGLLFFIVAKLTDLTTAAMIGAAVGLGLIIAQRFVKADLLGGLALFGIVMMLLSAGFAWWFQDDDMVKMRSTVMGLIGAAVFLGDGLLNKGRYIGAGLARYIAYVDIRPRRLAIGMGLTGLMMALLNYGVARLFSTDIWLFYTTFGDVFVSFAMAMYAISWARRGAL